MSDAPMGAVERVDVLDLIDEYGRASQEAGRADMAIGYDPGRHYKYEECDSAKHDLVTAVTTLTADLARERARSARLAEVVRMALDDSDVTGPDGRPLPLMQETLRRMRAALAEGEV